MFCLVIVSILCRPIKFVQLFHLVHIKYFFVFCQIQTVLLMMNTEDVARILNRFSHLEIAALSDDGLDAVRDYFADRGVEGDSESEGDDEVLSSGEHRESYQAEDEPMASRSAASPQLLIEEAPAGSTEDISDSDAVDDVPDVVTVQPVHIPAQQLFHEILHPEEELKVTEFVQHGCGCQKGPDGQSCLKQFGVPEIVENRLNCFELDYMSEHENRLNSVIVAELNALLHRDDKLMCAHSSFKAQKERKKQFMDYRFRGYSVCMNGFLFLHGIGRKRLRLLRKRVSEFGIQSVKHGNTGRVPAIKVQSFDDVKRVVTFLQNYAENNALILPGRMSSCRDSSLKLLPSWETKSHLYALYTKSCLPDIKGVSFSSFVRIWKTSLPSIVIQLPRTDLCATCQQNTVKLSELANMDEELKAKRIKNSLDHLTLVQQERLVYTATIQNCKQMYSGHPTKTLGSLPQGEFQGCSHVSFDFAQQVHVPHLPDQPGPLYFLTPYKIGIFGISNEAAGVQVNYVIPESVLTGKGPNAIASMLHHYLEMYSLGETVLFLHADNCCGQNKNNTIMQYLCWRVMVGLNDEITIMFLPVGHTKFAPDAGFGIIKSRFRRSLICNADELCNCIEMSTPSTKLNRAHLVGTEAGVVHVPTYDWQDMFRMMQLKRIPGIKKLHHFAFSRSDPRTVVCKEHNASTEKVMSMCDRVPTVDSKSLPAIVTPAGLSPERQWYLFESIRPLVPERSRDIICPKPTCERRTFAEARAEKAGPSGTGEKQKPGQVKRSSVKKTKVGETSIAAVPASLPGPSRKPQSCSYCSMPGHVNRVLRGKIVCPKRRVDEGT